jgi:predicted glycosyltransferase
MPSYVFTSHDGFGLGHVRRNVSLAEAVLRSDPHADITVVTGVATDLPWLRRRDLRVVRVPSLVKDGGGAYRNDRLTPEQVAERRAEVFRRVVDTVCPDVVVVDRHPFGTLGELRPGLERCRQLGTATVLGLRDVIDDAAAVRSELASERWHGAADAFDQALVYGAPHVCDHVTEYGLPMTPEYVGWVNARPMQPRRQPTVDEHLLVIAAGGGADGADVRRIGADLVRANPDWRGQMVVGPLGDLAEFGDRPRLDVLGAVEHCGDLMAGAAATVQMAGYNTTVEALAAGVRPLLVPRRQPRREQAIRAARLASLGVADSIDPDASVEELSWLLRRPRRLSSHSLADAGVDLDGAERTARVLATLAGVRHRSFANVGAGR